MSDELLSTTLNGGSKKQPTESEIAERRHLAYQYRTRRYTYRQIGRELNVSAATAYNDVQSILAEVNAKTQETALNVRDMEVAMLDELQRALVKKGKAGDLRTIDRMLKIMERRAKLLGLDAAIKHEHAGADGGAIKTEGSLRIEEMRETVPETEAYGLLDELARRVDVLKRQRQRKPARNAPA
jgi:DNA-binding CsgD family transcriptional regulator